MDKLGNLFGTVQTTKKTRRTERGDLVSYFLGKVNMSRGERYKKLTYGAMAYFLTGIPTKDLYYVRSVCDDWERKNKPWGALFWKLVRPRT